MDQTFIKEGMKGYKDSAIQIYIAFDAISMCELRKPNLASLHIGIGKFYDISHDVSVKLHQLGTFLTRR